MKKHDPISLHSQKSLIDESTLGSARLLPGPTPAAGFKGLLAGTAASTETQARKDRPKRKGFQRSPIVAGFLAPICMGEDRFLAFEKLLAFFLG